MKSFAGAVLIVLALPTLSSAEARSSKADPMSLCASRPAELAVPLARHRALERLRAKSKDSESTAPRVTRSGQIALIEDDGTLFAPPNTFDLSGRSLQFLRRPKGTAVVRFNTDFKLVLGERLPLAADGAAEVVFPEDFRFPFGDTTYDRAWVNANGSLTFGGRDPGAGNASLARLVGGPPRIAPASADLDPEAAPEGGGVFVNFLPKRVRVTWFRVPFSRRSDSEVSAQVTLFLNGRVVVSYGEIEASHPLVVGISPDDSDFHVVSYDQDLPVRPRPGAFGELFSRFSEVDDLAVARTFFDHFADDYDHLVVWLGFNVAPDEASNFRPYHLNAKNDVRGIGLELFDATGAFGSDGRLEGYVQMLHEGSHPEDPDGTAHFTLSAIGWVAQEIGHRWLAHARFREGGEGRRSDALLACRRSGASSTTPVAR